MRILFAASGEFAVPTLESLHRSDHEIAAVVTQPARKAGRGRQSRPTPVGDVAAGLGYEVIAPEDVNEPDVVRRLASLDARLGLVIAFGQKLGPELIGAVPAGFVNLHASLLPRYRGAAPIQWAVINGEERSGVTVFRLTSRMDAGPILTSRWTCLKPVETAAELHDRLARIGPDAVAAALELFEGGRVPEGQPQDESEATRAPKLSKQSGIADLSRPARELANLVCGLWSWPGATCDYVAADGSRRERVLLARARVGDDRPADVAPGEIDVRLFVATGDGWLELLEVKPASGKLMTWPAYVNGRHVKAGARFVPPASE